MAAVLSACTIAGAAGLAGAQTINVSALVTGTSQRAPSAGPGTPCTSQCSWTTVSGAASNKTFAVSPGNLMPTAWPPVWTAGKPKPHERSDSNAVEPTQSQPETGLDPYPQHLAEVRYNDYAFATDPKRHLSTETYRIGNGAAAMAYSVRISNNTPASQAQWLEFQLPDDQPTIATATDGLAGPSGYESSTAQPEMAMRRTSLDVVVDGLPVWSSEWRSAHLKRQFANDPDTQIRTGPALNGGGKVTLFLGFAPAKAVTHVTLLSRVDGRLQAPTCKVDTVPDPIHGNKTYSRCHAERLRIDIPSWNLPSVGGGASPQVRPAMQVFLN